MATIASLALAIRARTERLKQDLKPALDEIKHWGASAVAAGGDAKEVNREMARMRAEALRGSDAARTTTRSFGETLRSARTAASALTGAISAVSGEIGGAVGHVTRLGSSIAQAFLAGGPIAAGVTAVTAGIAGLIAANNEVAEAAKRAAEEHRKWLDDAQKRVEALRDSVRNIQADLRATLLGAPELSGEFREQLRIDRERAGIWKQMRDAQERMREHQQTIDTTTVDDEFRAAAAGGEAGGYTRGDRSRAQQGVSDEREKLDALRKQLDALEEEERALDRLGDARRQVAAEEAAADAQRKQGLDEQKRQQDEIAASIRAAVEASQRWLQTQDRLTASAARMRTTVEGIAKQAKSAGDIVAEGAWSKLTEGQNDSLLRLARAQDQRAAAKKASAERMQGYREELEDLQAGNRFARDRLEINRELERRLKAAQAANAGAAEVEAIRAVAAARLTKLANEEADAVKRAADEKARATKEMREQVELARKQVDITKRFAALPGTGGAFGFGAGTPGLTWSGGSGDMGRRRGQRPQTAKGQLGEPAAASLDSSGKLKAIEGAWSKLPEALAREKAALASLEKSVLDGTARILKATEKSIASLKATVREHERRIREGEKRLARVGDVGVD